MLHPVCTLYVYLSIHIVGKLVQRYIFSRKCSPAKLRTLAAENLMGSRLPSQYSVHLPSAHSSCTNKYNDRVTVAFIGYKKENRYSARGKYTDEERVCSRRPFLRLTRPYLRFIQPRLNHFRASRILKKLSESS